MQRFKKAIFIIALSALLPLGAMGADEDGTFTISIQGPEVEDTAPVARAPAPERRATPRRTYTPRAVTPTAPATPRATTNRQRTVTPTVQANNTPIATAASNRSYSVRSGDTIWSVAHRYVPTDRSLDEFQIVASIYRNNPNAFSNGNVNNLTRTTLRIPDNSQIARETTQTGSQLLSQGRIILPPLTAPVAQNIATTTPATTVLPATAPNSQPATSFDANIPVYTATETQIKEIQEQKAQEQDNELIPVKQTNKDEQNANESRQNPVSNLGNTAPATASNSAPTAPQLQALSQQASLASVDIKSIQIMLDENKKAIDEKTKGMEMQLAEAVNRMKKSSAVTAQTASDSVASLSSQYDNIIASIQQDLIEIKGNISKLSQDNDRMREMLLANDEKIEDMQLQMSQFSFSTSDTKIDVDRPVMMVLIGAGLLSLALLILFMIFKAKARAHAKKYTDDFDIDESLGSEDMLLSDANGSIELEAPAAFDEDEKEEQTPPKTENINENAIDAPAKAPTETDIPAADDGMSEAERSAQKEWEEATKSKSDDDVLDEWSQALDESNGKSEKEVEVKSDDESVADAWAAALNDQEKTDKTEDSKSAEDKEQEDMAAAWAAALDGDSEKKEEEPKSAEDKEQEDMAAAWAAALDGDSEKKDEVSKSQEEAPSSSDEEVTSQWSAPQEETEQSDKKDEQSFELKDEDQDKKSDVAPISEANAFAASMQSALNQNNESTDNVDNQDDESVLESMMDSSPEELEDSDEHKDILDPALDIVEKNTDNLDDLQEEQSVNDFSLDDDTFGKKEPEDNELADLNSALASETQKSRTHVEPLDDDLLAELHDSSEETKHIKSKKDTSDNVDDFLASLESDNETEGSVTSTEEKQIKESLKNGKEPTDADISSKDALDLEQAFANAVDTSVPLEESSSDNTVGSNVDEVLNDDLDLESLLNEDTGSEDETDNLEDYSNIEDNSADEPQTDTDEAVEAEPQTDIDELVEAEPQTDIDETVEEEPQTDIGETVEEEPQIDIDETVEEKTQSDNEEAVEYEPQTDINEAAEEQPQTDIDEITPVEEVSPESELEDILSGNEENIIDESDIVDSENTKDEADNDNQSDVVSWEVPSDDYDVVSASHEQNNTEDFKGSSSDEKHEIADKSENEESNDSDLENTFDSIASGEQETSANKEDDIEAQSSKEDLAELESRIGGSQSMYDPEAENDLMNMLSSNEGSQENDDSSLHENGSIAADDIAAMMGSTENELVDDVVSNKADDIEPSSYEEQPNETIKDPQDSVLESVFDKIGPISAIEEPSQEVYLEDEPVAKVDDFEGLTPKEHQYYVDELNLARLYFETGDTEEAIKIIDDVKEHGSSDLKEEVAKIIETYGN